ncbi:GNAT family N-acetyltransferase [Promicromonospora iranensis]|uniref:GNAT family N-acetyltransferase n=1 Tax=Promicromonospora iranensis TaxID=1105144 RepID=UPI0023A95A79|nr:GNAT family N-acetyltransferase [Promicromonospora iranensis]
MDIERLAVDEAIVTIADAATLSELAVAFRTWPKPVAVFEQYTRRSRSDEIVVLAARTGGTAVGYCLVEWDSSYSPFVAAGIPEIVDLNVLRDRQGRGAGRALLNRAEQLAASRSDRVGLRVGLYADYGRAQRLYARRGYVPDGAGVTVDGVPVSPGSTIVLDDEPVLALTRALRNT